MKAENINKSYGKQSVLKNINLNFDNNGIVFILGDSGSGKSTLLNTLGLLDDNYEGNIFFDNDKAIVTENERNETRKRHIAFVFQEYNLINSLTVKENILTSVEISNNTVDTDKYNRIIKMFKIGDLENRNVTTLSGGEKQRVAIARALLRNNEIIFADEPTGNLDEKNSIIIFDSLKEISKNHLIVVVSHNKEMSEKYADRIITIKDGVVCSDTDKGYNNKSALVLQNDSTSNTKNGKWIKRILFRGFKMRRFKLIPSMISILISLLCVGFVCGIFSATNNIIQSAASDIIEADKLEIVPNGYALVDSSLTEALAENPNIKKSLGVLDSLIFIHQEDMSIGINTNVITGEEFFCKRVKLKSGRPIENDNEVYVNEDMAKNFFGGNDEAIGKTLPLEYTSEKVTIVGVVSQKKSVDGKQYEITLTDNCSRKLAKDIIKAADYCNISTDSVALMNSAVFKLLDKNPSIRPIIGKMPQRRNEVLLDISSVNAIIYEQTGKALSNDEILSGKADELLNEYIFSPSFRLQYMSQCDLLSLKIVGICNTNPSENLVFYVNEKEIDSWINNAISKIEVYVNDYSEESLDEIRNIAEDNNCSFLYDAEAQAELFNGIFNALAAAVAAISVITIVISCILVNQVTKTNIIDRTYEIGVLKSLGASKSSIFKLFTFENILTGFIVSSLTILILVILMLSGVSDLAKIGGISFYIFEWWHVAVTIAVGLFISFMSGVGKVRKAANMSVTDAIRTKDI